MAEFLIKDEQLVGLKDKVAIVTGTATPIWRGSLSLTTFCLRCGG